MSDHVATDFPFEFKVMDPEEQAVLHKHFIYDYNSTCRVGPKGYILNIGDKAEIGNIYNMPVKSDDVFVCSFPRSGTTWTQELVWLLVKDLNYADARSTPLTQRYTYIEYSTVFTKKCVDDIIYQNKIKSVESNVEYLKELNRPGTEVVAACPSPRFIKTHLPLSFLPPKAIENAKMVYVARDPRDVAVSYYHLNRLLNYSNYAGDFKSFWDLFRRNLVLYTPIFEHLKEAWALRKHPNMLFFFYEDLSNDLPAAVRRVANFFSKQLTEEQFATLCDHLSFENFKKNESVNGFQMEQFGVFKDKSFIRKGKAGGWHDYFDEEMREQAERWIADNLRDTDLRFPHLETSTLV